MKNPFYYYVDTGGFVIEDRKTGLVVARGVSPHYIHLIVDCLNANVKYRMATHELLKAFE